MRMSRWRASLVGVVIGASMGTAATAEAGEPCHAFSPTIEAPCTTVIKQADSYQIRSYAESAPQFWTSAEVESSDFDAAGEEGFYKNFGYISGANDKQEKIPMTSPVLFRQGSDGSGWLVSFFVPSSFASREAVPEPTDDNVHITAFPEGGVTFAAIEFGGFAKYADYLAKKSELLALLERDGVQLAGGEWGSVFLGYDSPFVAFNRHNEVWVRVSVSSTA